MGMDAWIYLLFAFMSGLVLGGAFVSLRFRAKVDLYKEFIEKRLSSPGISGSSIQE